jgi:NADPH-dependent glutamate synthase beta subunit-like oxidoreductase/ferredoxin/Pyruvate/2-oxoacid:ferredoxin oxidoreductase delta subunit
MIKLTINGTPVEVSEGTTVLAAAQQAGIYIPTLCYHPAVAPFGACRLCLVEIENAHGPATACTTPATDGMVIQTDTPLVQKLRRSILELILTEHPHLCLTCWRRERCAPNDICLRNVAVTERCVTCPKNKNCELQRLVDYIGIEDIALTYTYKGIPVDDQDPLIVRDYNLCVLCGRCIQVCQEVRGIGAINFTQRGSNTVVGTAFNHPLSESGCRYCGACVEVCPTGALMDKAAVRNFGAEHDAVAVPCHYECPAGINVPLYVYLISEGKFADALAIIREKVPFPSVLGRVCIHPCEEGCRRGELNEPISIKFLKRFVADRDTGDWKERSVKLPATGRKTAVVGAGPAGLTCAYYLAKLGHAVTVFEELPYAGGMMRFGIPDYRLPKDVLDTEITEILSAGVELKLNNRVETMDELREQGYEAIFLGIGAHRGMKPGVEGEDSPGVVDGATFLRKVALGEPIDTGDRVAVIGGGNVAIDSARTALRLGAKQVTIVYRRTMAEMPASEEEVEGAIEEGVEMMLLSAPNKIATKDGHLVMTCTRMELGEPDASRRRRPVPVKGSEFDREFETIIAAIGQQPDVPDGFQVKAGRGNTIQANTESQNTGQPDVWTGGDCHTGPDSVIRAIAAGRRAASSIDKYLGGQGVIDEELTTEREFNMYTGHDKDFVGRQRTAMPCLEPADREGFVEVELGFGEAAAIAEASRCCQCGVRLQIPEVPQPPSRVGQSAGKR